LQRSLNQQGLPWREGAESVGRRKAWVCIEPRRGAYVRQFSAKEIRDLYELREILEVHSIDAAKRHRPKLLNDLVRQHPNRTKKFLKDGNKLEHIEEGYAVSLPMITAATGNEGTLSRPWKIFSKELCFAAPSPYELFRHKRRQSPQL